ncbi:MAG: hypothetical protein ACI4QI_05755, partial [Candidatus Coproplasma sp.]
MTEENKKTQEELNIEELIQSSESCVEEQTAPALKEEAQTAEVVKTEDENKVFKKYKIKDIVFLA